MLDQALEKQPETNPRHVTRGLNLQTCFLGLDSLYVVMEYPHIDIYDLWTEPLQGTPEKFNLYRGVLHEGFVLKVGGNGYKLSVWDGDARLYLTDQVTETLYDTKRAGQGMGLMLQLGPKWLRSYGHLADINLFKQSVRAQFSIFGVRKYPLYPIRLNRLDLALDIPHLSTQDFDVKIWRKNWVGFASKKQFHMRHDQLDGFSIGTSEGAVRFKVYDKVLEASKNNSRGFWDSVWQFKPGDDIPVTRFEWTLKPYKANFNGMRYLKDFSLTSLCDLINYATLKWGRLCVPDETDSNRSRWPLEPLWEAIREILSGFTFNHSGVAERVYNTTPDISETYVQSMAGWLSGMQARIALENGATEPASVRQLLQYLQENGFPIEKLTHQAQAKLVKMARLAHTRQLDSEAQD